jgi:hypothetical protein
MPFSAHTMHLKTVVEFFETDLYEVLEARNEALRKFTTLGLIEIPGLLLLSWI